MAVLGGAVLGGGGDCTLYCAVFKIVVFSSHHKPGLELAVW